MSNFSERRFMLEAAQAAGGDAELAREWSQDFEEVDTADDSPKLMDALQDILKNRELRNHLFDLFETRTIEDFKVPQLVELYNTLGDQRMSLNTELSTRDTNLIRFTERYLCDWLLAGQWVKKPEKRVNRDFNYLLLPAALLNFITKLKTDGAYEKQIPDLDRDTLFDLVANTREFSERYLEPGNLQERAAFARKQGLTKEEQELKKLAYDSTQAIATITQSQASVERELKNRYSPAAGLYLSKTIITACAMQWETDEKQGEHLFVPPTQMETERNEYRYYNFRTGRNEADRAALHYPTHRIVFGKYVVEYLRDKTKPTAA